MVQRGSLCLNILGPNNSVFRDWHVHYQIFRNTLSFYSLAASSITLTVLF